MIFYEVIHHTVNPRTRMRCNKPYVFPSRKLAMTMFTAIKKRMDKDATSGDSVCLNKVKANIELTQKEWLKLFLGDHIGSHNVEEDKLLFVRDLIVASELCKRHQAP